MNDSNKLQSSKFDLVEQNLMKSENFPVFMYFLEWWVWSSCNHWHMMVTIYQFVRYDKMKKTCNDIQVVSKGNTIKLALMNYTTLWFMCIHFLLRSLILLVFLHLKKKLCYFLAVLNHLQLIPCIPTEIKTFLN